MHITINNVYQFRDQFHEANRNDQFSYEALELLFDYLEDYDANCELDVIALCCEYAEDTVENLAKAYNVELEENDSEEDKEQKVLDFLNEATVVIGTTPYGILYQQC
jgi:hypothetical protein